MVDDARVCDFSAEPEGFKANGTSSVNGTSTFDGKLYVQGQQVPLHKRG
jgi:hypothetical protein